MKLTAPDGKLRDTDVANTETLSRIIQSIPSPKAEPFKRWLPPLDEQREINAVLDDARREIVLLQTEVKALKQQKRGLMQKLLTGQWRMPVESKAVAA